MSSTQPRSITSQRTAAHHAKQRRYCAEIKEAEESLKIAKQSREHIGMRAFLVGLSCFLGLPVLVLLNAGQDAPVLQFLLGIQGGDGWETPLGNLQPLAIGASIAVVIAMGLAALLALGHDSSEKGETHAWQ